MPDNTYSFERKSRYLATPITPSSTNYHSNSRCLYIINANALIVRDNPAGFIA